MADKYINETGLATIKAWLLSKFATNTDLDALTDRVDDIEAEGGEPNVIETVKLNGTALTPTNKAVDVTVPTKTSDLTNDGDGSSNFATQEYVAENGGKIDKIKVNGTEQTITNKTVDIEVPTKVSDLTNDSNFQDDEDVSEAITTALANGTNPYQTKSDVDAEIASQIGGAYKPQGTVPFANLPAPSASNEHYVYDISDAFVTTADFKEGAGHSHPAGTNVACIEVSAGVFKWDCMAGFIDTSTFWSNAEGQTNSLTAATVAEINAILNA